MFFFPFYLIPFIIFLIVIRFGVQFIKEIKKKPGSREGRKKIFDLFNWDDEIESPKVTKIVGLGSNKFESRIFKIANKYKGKLTLSDIVIETDLGIKEAEDSINKLVDGMRIRMEVNNKGLVVYEFPEIMERYSSSNSSKK